MTPRFDRRGDPTFLTSKLKPDAIIELAEVTSLLLQRQILEGRRKRMQSELERAVSCLREMGAERIILFGSMAGESPNPYGDIDLLVVMRTKDRFLDRLKKAYLAVQPSVAMDILVYTPEEFEEMKESSPFVSQALKEGRELYAA